MKTLYLVILFILLIVPVFAPVLAQQPIPTAQGQALGPFNGQPLPIAPRDYAPTWQAPWPPPFAQPTIAPTANPTLRRAYVQSRTLLYEINRYTGKLSLFVPATLTTIGETITVRLIDATWAQAVDGWYATKLVERWALRLL